MALVSVGLSGCIWPVPHTSQRSPEVSGRVLDATTQAPIAKAKVALHDCPSVTTATDNSGSFVLRATHNFHYASRMGMCWTDLPEGKQYGPSIEVSHPRYVAAQIDSWRYQKSDSTNYSIFRLKDVLLERASK